jgi:hypothetical protein
MAVDAWVAFNTDTHILEVGPAVHTASNIKKNLGSKVRPVRGSDNLTAIYEQIVSQCGFLNISQPYRPPRPVMGIASYFAFMLKPVGRRITWLCRQME